MMNRDLKNKFEKFCDEYNLEYDFSELGGYYKNYITHNAFIVWKYARNQEK
jgi:hypothetical protein